MTKNQRPVRETIFPSASIKRGFKTLRSAFCPLQYRLRLVDDLHSRAVLQYRTKNKKQIPLFFLVNNYIWQKVVRCSLAAPHPSTAIHGAHVPGAKIISLFCLLLSFRTTAYNDKIQQLPNRGCLYYRKPHESQVGAWNEKETWKQQQTAVCHIQLWCFNHFGWRKLLCIARSYNCARVKSSCESNEDKNRTKLFPLPFSIKLWIRWWLTSQKNTIFQSKFNIPESKI